MNRRRIPTIEEALEAYLAEQASRGATARATESFARTVEALRRFKDGVDCTDVFKMNAPDVAGYAEEEVRKGGDVEARLRPVKDFLDYLERKGWHQESLAVHVKIPRPPAAKGRRRPLTTPPSDGMKMTERSLIARVQELANLTALLLSATQMFQTFDRVAIEDRVRDLKGEIGRAVVVETTKSSSADLSAVVSLHGLDDGTTKSYTLVGPFEANPSEGKLSIKSPVGEAVVGKRKGDRVTIKTPSGSERRYRIEDVRF